MKEMRVLIIDDDPVDRRIVKTKLRKHGWSGRIDEFESAIQALDHLRERKKKRPRIIMLDINMPKMSGFEFLAEIRSDPELGKNVVFMLTSSDDPKDIEAAFSHCVAGYLTKESLAPSYKKLADLLESYEAATTW